MNEKILVQDKENFSWLACTDYLKSFQYKKVKIPPLKGIVIRDFVDYIEISAACKFYC